MSKLYCDNDKYGYQCDFPISEAYNSAVKDLVEDHTGSLEEMEDFVFKTSLISLRKDMLEISPICWILDINLNPLLCLPQGAAERLQTTIFMTKISVLSMKKPRLRQLIKMGLNFIKLGTTLCPMTLILEELPYMYAR